MKIIDLKYQSVAPANPSPNTLGVFVDSGNQVVHTLISGGIKRQIGITYTGGYTDIAIATGKGVIGTGTFFGGTGNGTVPATGLCSPYLWLPVITSNGTNVAIPAYLLAP